MKKKYWPMIGLCLLISLSSACSSSNEAKDNNEEKKLTPVTQVTNWFAEPEHGGQYAALMKGFYKDAGMEMTLLPGGPQVSSTQIVASGKAQFGMAQADELLLARSQGIPIVAIAAVFQKSPQGFLFHKGEPIKSFADLNGRKVYTTPGAGYWEYMKKAYKLDQVQEMKYTGQLVNFIHDPKSVTQCYITSEPFSLKQQGHETEYLLIPDSGYSPYVNLLFTTEKLLQEKPELVKAYVEASIKGRDYYKTHSDEINPFIKEKNPNLTLEALKYAAKAQMDLIYGGEAATSGVGYMSKERWSTLMKQLVDMGLLKKEEDISKAFTNEFLPKK